MLKIITSLGSTIATESRMLKQQTWLSNQRLHKIITQTKLQSYTSSESQNENKSHKNESVIHRDNSFIQRNLLFNRRTCKMTGEI